MVATYVFQTCISLAYFKFMKSLHFTIMLIATVAIIL